MLICLLSWLAISNAASVESLKFSVLDIPGAIRTTARGINSDALIVGDLTNPAFRNEGYLRFDKSVFASTPISMIRAQDSVFPVIEAVSTTVTALNDVRWIVGSYRDTSFVSHGFFYDTSNPFGYPSYQPISIFEATFTDALGINKGTIGNGWSPKIVGEYVDLAGVTHGYVVSTGFVANAQGAPLTPDMYQAIDFPGASVTYAAGINDGDQIVGGYRDTNSLVHGYLLSNGNFTTIDFPGAFYTYVWGINNNGKVVGYYFDGVATHGFTCATSTNKKALKFNSFDFPNSIGTYSTGINDFDQIVGSYRDAQGVFHGFLASPPSLKEK